MTARKKTGIPANHTSTAGQGFGDFQRPEKGSNGQNSVEDHRTATSTQDIDAPSIPDHQTESALILQAANAGIEAVTRLDSIMSQATAKVAAASEQLAIQAADQDAFVLGGGHYLTTYFNRLNAHQAANRAYQDELDFQTRIDQAMAQRAQLPQANRVLAELNLLPRA
jgi:hypothetical protein